MNQTLRISQYKGADIYWDDETETYYWENASGVIVGEDLASLADCKADIDCDEEYSAKRNLCPYAYLG